MIHSIKQELTLSVPLTLAAHQRAQLFYKQHPDPHKAKQVYLNTLAVEAVRTYLGWVGIASDRQASDSQNPIIQTLSDVADLELPGIGKLECRPVLPEETKCHIPPETNAGRIGYLPVLFDTALETATLLGFIPSADIGLHTQVVPLTSIQSLDVLLDLAQTQTSLSTEFAHLSRWLKDCATSSWQPVEALLTPQPVFSFRSLELSNSTASSAILGKLLELTPPGNHASSVSLVDDLPSSERVPIEVSALDQSTHCRIALVVGITIGDDLQSDILVKLCPVGKRPFLPEDLDIRILDDQDVVVMEAKSRQTDMLQFNFRGILNEKFAVKVSLNGVSVVEKFVI